jgi:hypothetical protein
MRAQPRATNASWMSYLMARIRLLRIEAQLLALFLIDAVLNPSMPAIFALGCLLMGAFLCYVGGPGVFVIGALSALQALFIWLHYVRELNPVHDKPLRAPLSSFPALETELRTICSEFRVPLPRRIAFSLSPWQWQPFGCDVESAHISRRDLAIPVGCLEFWSIFGLRCYVAHALVRRRPPRWLFSALEWSLTEPGIPPTRKRRLILLMATWRMMADMEADRRVARKYGSFLVQQYIQETLLLYKAVADCVKGIVEPLTRGGILLPVASYCRTFHTLFESAWVEHVNDRFAAPHNPLLLRISVLPRTAGAAQVHDSRPCVNLFGDLAALEERVVRNELKLPAGRPLRRGTMADVSALYLPAMQRIVRRNSSLLHGRSIHDLPDLARNVAQLALSVRENAGDLPLPAQRGQQVVQLLEVFLALELCTRAGWTVNLDIKDGLSLRHGEKILRPGLIVKSLQSGEMTAEAFRRMLDDMGIS